MHKMMWAYMIQLGENMWGDEGGTRRWAPFFPQLNTDDAVWREVIDFLPSQGFNTVLIDIGDAIQYESHPEISIPGAWSKDKFKKELDYMRSIGLTPLPKLNFSAGHKAWLKEYGRMLATSIYYRVCEDLIKEVAELFDYPEYFHLGMDEEDASNQSYMSYCCIRQKDLWWHDVYFLFDICEKLGMRPWVWADACWNNPDEYFAKMPKSVLQSNWAYHEVKKNPDGTYRDKYYQAYVELEKRGFDQVPTSSTWSVNFNTHETMELGKAEIAPERLLGYMTAPWDFTVPQAKYTLLNDALRFGYAKKAVYPEID